MPYIDWDTVIQWGGNPPHTTYVLDDNIGFANDLVDARSTDDLVFEPQMLEQAINPERQKREIKDDDLENFYDFMEMLTSDFFYHYVRIETLSYQRLEYRDLKFCDSNGNLTLDLKVTDFYKSYRRLRSKKSKMALLEKAIDENWNWWRIMVDNNAETSLHCYSDTYCRTFYNTTTNGVFDDAIFKKYKTFGISSFEDIMMDWLSPETMLVDIHGNAIPDKNIRNYKMFQINSRRHIDNEVVLCKPNEYISIAIIPLDEYDRSKDFTCEQCGDKLNELFISKVEVEGHIMCKDCSCDIRRCSVCGRMITQRDLELDTAWYSDDDDCYYCSNECYNNSKKYKIKAYHDNPTLEFYDIGEDGHNHIIRNVIGRKFNGYGIELEVGKAGQKNENSELVIKCLNEEVYAMRDGSINRDGVLGGDDYDYGGFEIITQPHTEAALYNMNWKEAFRLLIHKGYRSHDIKTCGLHMHINRSLFKDQLAVAKMLFFYEYFWDDIVKFSRRKEHELERWSSKIFSKNTEVTLKRCLDHINVLDRHCNHELRYHSVNLQNMATIEIRTMRGTLKLSTFLATLDFMITIAKNANLISETDIYSPIKWLQGMKPETIKYIKSRGCFGFKVDVDDEVELEENLKEEE